MTDQDRYAGMTLNERLFAAGLLDRFDAAVRAGDRAALAEILAQVGIAAEEAKHTMETILAHPTRYGRVP